MPPGILGEETERDREREMATPTSYVTSNQYTHLPTPQFPSLQVRPGKVTLGQGGGVGRGREDGVMPSALTLDRGDCPVNRSRLALPSRPRVFS